MSLNKQYSFQDSFSISFDNISFLHHFVFIFLLGILIFVIYILIMVLLPMLKLNRYNHLVLNYLYIKKIFYKSTSFIHDNRIELIWTLIPSLIIASLIIPSFNLLYGVTESFSPELTIKVIGHQWYWSYEYTYIHAPFIAEILNQPQFYSFLKAHSGYGISTTYFEELVKFYDDIYNFNFEQLRLFFTFDSSILMESNVILRLLQVDNVLILPTQTNIKFITTSDDVIHSFAVPSLGLKMDSVPGRLNETSVYIKRDGNYIGQCSEICGVNHAYMPINIIAISKELFNSYSLKAVKSKHPFLGLHF